MKECQSWEANMCLIYSGLQEHIWQKQHKTKQIHLEANRRGEELQDQVGNNG